jgi:asparagine synthase (glutamine-hydrolysing)
VRKLRFHTVRISPETHRRTVTLAKLVSGIVGIVNLDRAPVDRRLLARMTQSLAFRGPDAQSVMIEGATGFGHTLLRSTDEPEHERQPLTLNGEAWIVADARIDARQDLIENLKSQGEAVADDVSDAELILRSFSVWRERCVEHLLGDFAFGIWDARQQRLFCARDHMGVKPFYYASIGQRIIFSNTLDCIRLHPSVSDRLNDMAIADFLLFNLNQDKATTTFADIWRLPPAHCATSSASGLRLQRYWTLPIDEPIYYRRQEDYVDSFKEILGKAVGDRLRTNRVGVFMSGGLDSTTLAATARGILSSRVDDSEVCAFTTSYQGYEQEARYAGIAAKSLGIPIRYQSWSAQRVDPNWYNGTFHTSEPIPHPASLASDLADYRDMASYSRVALYGEGPDNALRYEWRSYIHYLSSHKRWGRLLYDLYNHAVSHRRVPLLSSVSAMISKRGTKSRRDAAPPFPDWFNSDFENSLQLRSRWEQFWRDQDFIHPIRPSGHASFELPLWQAIFESFDVARTRAPLEVRLPFLDLRVLRFLLAVPVLPWCRSKYLLRRSMRGILPEAVLKRPKTPVLHDPYEERVEECGLPLLQPTRNLDRYVDSERLRRAAGVEPSMFWVDFRARSLNYWLRNNQLFEKQSLQEGSEWNALTSAK